MNCSYKKNVTVFLVIMTLLSTQSFSQENDMLNNKQQTQSLIIKQDYNSWSVGAKANVLSFLGDLQTYDFHPLEHSGSKTKIGASVFANKAISNVFSLQPELSFGNLGGQRTDWKETFEASFFQFNINAMVNLTNINFFQPTHHSNKYSFFRDKFHLYAYAGFGLISFDSDVTSTESNEIARSATNSVKAVIPMGLTAKYYLNDRVNLFLDLCMNNVYADRLDATKIAGTTKDRYSSISIGFSVVLGQNEQHLERVNPMDAVISDLVVMSTKFAGLQKDSDEDGVPNYLDKDNFTPKGVVVDSKGLPFDLDKDGVYDGLDKDKTTPEGDFVDEYGISKDADGDGVPDYRDLEKDTPKGTQVNFQGQSIQAQDNKLRHDDILLIKQLLAQTKLGNVYFEFGGTTIDKKYFPVLADVASMMKNTPGMVVEVIGHTDSKGNEKNNAKLGEERAKAVVDAMVKYFNVEVSRFVIKTSGESDLLSNITDDKADISNRRVEFKLKLD